MPMKIRIKGIVHERVEDAPFIGALISAIDCNLNCKGCFNQHIKELETIEMDSEEILNKVLENPFNEGIILAGLEWSLQEEELRELVSLARKKGLKVMIYSGLSEEELKKSFQTFMNLREICTLSSVIMMKV